MGGVGMRTGARQVGCGLDCEQPPLFERARWPQRNWVYGTSPYERATRHLCTARWPQRNWVLLSAQTVLARGCCRCVYSVQCTGVWLHSLTVMSHTPTPQRIHLTHPCVCPWFAGTMRSWYLQPRPMLHWVVGVAVQMPALLPPTSCARLLKQRRPIRAARRRVPSIPYQDLGFTRHGRWRA